jgi:TolA-binding protein
MIRVIATVFFFIAALLLQSCASMQDKWEAAAKEDTKAAYYRFIREDDPDPVYEKKAKARIRELEEIEKKKRLEQEEEREFTYIMSKKPVRWDPQRPEKDLEYFLKKYPSGKNAPQAREKLEMLAYDRALKENRSYDFKNFLDRFPGSSRAPEANRLLRTALFNEARKSESVAAYENFIKSYPQGQDTEELMKDLPKVRALEQAKQEQERKNKSATELGETALNMALVPLAKTQKTADGLIVQSMKGMVLGHPPTLTMWMNRFRKQLAAGADPDLIRIIGFRAHYIYPGGGISFGQRGRVVTGAKGGMTLMEFCKENKLDEAVELLKQRSRKK